MDRRIASLVIEGPGTGRGTKVWLDGKRVERIRSVSIVSGLDTIPTCEIETLHPAGYTVALDRARVLMRHPRLIDRIRLAWRVLTERPMRVRPAEPDAEAVQAPH